MFQRSSFGSLDGRYKVKEQEQMDRAVALSLAEDWKRPSAQFSSRGGWAEDRSFGRELQGMGNAPAHHPYNPSPFNSTANSYDRSFRICGGCKRNIGYDNYIGCMGTFFHPGCFRCHACGYAVSEHEYSLSGKDPYHKSCFKQLTYPKCNVCLQPIPKNAAGLIEFKCHPFWSQKYCPSHETDNTARCCSCERLECRSAKHIAWGDGRSLCLECLDSAIMDTGECQPLYHAIRKFYEHMEMRIHQEIPMILVERQALNEAVVGEKRGSHRVPETRGLCLSEEQTVTSITSKPISRGERPMCMRTQPQKLIRTCEVTAILVLYGLPRLLTGAILAHELMHAWLRLSGYRTLNHVVEEGICQVLSYMWLESELGSMPSTAKPSSEIEKRLGKFFIYQIANDPSPAYGGGFRAAKAAVNKYGLGVTLDHIRYNGTFPS